MYAIFETGGKQYKVSEGDEVFVEKLNLEADDEIVFDKVAAIGGAEEGFSAGSPYLEGAKVKASVVKNGKSKKIIVFTYKSKKNEKRKKGHRQPYTLIKITGVETA